jgi:polyphosphate kinase 2 (PPK2 family)
VIAFEGMDAAGKGGAIKRIVKNLDPREYDIHCIGAWHRQFFYSVYRALFYIQLFQVVH